MSATHSGIAYPGSPDCARVSSGNCGKHLGPLPVPSRAGCPDCARSSCGDCGMHAVPVRMVAPLRWCGRCGGTGVVFAPIRWCPACGGSRIARSCRRDKKKDR